LFALITTLTRLWQTALYHITSIISYKPEYQSLHTGARVASTSITATQNIERDLPSLPYQVLYGLIGFSGLSYLGTSKYLKQMKFVGVIIGNLQIKQLYRLPNRISTVIEVSLAMLPSWIQILNSTSNCVLSM